jgi:crotonobetainyl-CoA:carnitine CoA-transferase CaiB-like acyl-CoA transferase
MLPLTGTTIIAVEQYGAGPFGSMLLADLGAEVIKIENPLEGGDVGRLVGPYFFSPGDSHFHQAFNRNKRSITLNLKHPDGMALFRTIAADADAVLDNLRGDLPEKLGLTYAALSEVNPAIVCAHLSAYGRGNSRESWPGYDYLMQAEAGYCSVTGEPDGPPARFGLSVVDMMAGLMCAFGLVSALVNARASGRGCDVDTSLFDTALHNLSYLAAWALNGGHVQGREARGAHPSLTPSQMYRTRDGWLFVMCNKDRFWPVFCDALGQPGWATDPRFAGFADRLANRAALTAAIEAVLARRDTAEWVATLSGRVPVAPVLDVGQALATPFVAETRAVAAFSRAEGGAPVRMVAPPLRVNGAHPRLGAAPALGADTDRVLARAGLSAAEVAQLRQKGAI